LNYGFRACASSDDGGFARSPAFDAAVLRDLFQASVLAPLLMGRMISPEHGRCFDPLKTSRAIAAKVAG